MDHRIAIVTLGLLFCLLSGCTGGGQGISGNAQSGASYPERIVCEGIVLIRVPQGERVIGTNNSRAMSHERPAVSFLLDYVLYMGRTEVTVGQFNMVMPEFQQRPLDGNDANEPVAVSRTMAKRFCERLGEKFSGMAGLRLTIRLPTEAEWEYAAMYARPPGEDWWPGGFFTEPNNTDFTEYAWYADNAGGKVHPVGRKRPNPLGLYDMVGNKAEWCEGEVPEDDSVKKMLGRNLGPAGRPTPSEQDERRTGVLKNWPIRGGWYMSSEEECRPSRRVVWQTSDVSMGFRVVVVVR